MPKTAVDKCVTDPPETQMAPVVELRTNPVDKQAALLKDLERHLQQILALDLPGALKLVLFILVYAAQGQEEVDMTLNELCYQATISRRAMNRHIGALIDQGFISRVGRERVKLSSFHINYSALGNPQRD